MIAGKSGELRLGAATAADLPLLLTMARAFHDEDGHPLTAGGESAIRRAVEGEPAARAWIVSHGDDRIGYVVVCLGFSIEHGGRDAFIDDLYVVPRARGRGLGGRILDLVAHAARDLGVIVLHVEVMAANERAPALYRRYGFAENGRRLMSKRLRPAAGAAARR